MFYDLEQLSSAFEIDDLLLCCFLAISTHILGGRDYKSGGGSEECIRNN